MKKIICPFCFHKFNKSEIWFRCENRICKGPDQTYPKNDEILDNFWKQNLHIKHYPFHHGFSLLGSETAKCPACKEATHKVICPECHNSLDREMLKYDSSIISIIGGKSSGKTNYITVLIRELSKKHHTFDASFTVIQCGDLHDGDKLYATAHRYEKDFYNKLYVGKEPHAGTAIASKENEIPLIYQLKIGELSRGKGKGKSVFLVFYDTAGENFTSPEKIAEKALFFKNSAGIIFLLDTFGIDRVREKIGNVGSNTPYNYIFDNVLDYIRNRMNKQERDEFKKKPMALAFSKIDTVLNDDDYDISGLKMNMNSSFLTDRKLSLQDLSGMHKGINDAMRGVWDENQFLLNVRTHLGEKVMFFGFSALGEMPVNNKVQDIRPYRVLDPLVWILHELGYPIPLKKEKAIKIEVKV